MGNCIESCRREEEDDDYGGAADVGAAEESGIEGAMRIKIVLRREELQWLMLQLNNNNNNGNKLQGEKRLEEALGEIERARSEKKQLTLAAGQKKKKKVEETTTVWKPVLGSIPEVSQYMI